MRVNFFVALPMEFAAFTVKEYEPASVGVPEIVPFVARVMPMGSLPLERVHVIGAVPEAVRVCVYGEAVVPAVREGVVIAGFSGFGGSEIAPMSELAPSGSNLYAPLASRSGNVQLLYCAEYGIAPDALSSGGNDESSFSMSVRSLFRPPLTLPTYGGASYPKSLHIFSERTLLPKNVDFVHPFAGYAVRSVSLCISL